MCGWSACTTPTSHKAPLRTGERRNSGKIHNSSCLSKVHGVWMCLLLNIYSTGSRGFYIVFTTFLWLNMDETMAFFLQIQGRPTAWDEPFNGSRQVDYLIFETTPTVSLSVYISIMYIRAYQCQASFNPSAISSPNKGQETQRRLNNFVLW